MSRYDEFVTDRELHLADMLAWLDDSAPNDLFRGRYVVSTTSGTTGRRAVIPADPGEWVTTVASYVRANDWAGVRAGVTHHLRLAVVSSTHAWHQSARVGATLNGPLVSALRLDAAQPLGDIVDALNAHRPELLVGYASILRRLADERSAGRLNVSPTAVISASEVLTTETRARIRTAFGVEPFDTFAATETGGIASECAEHGGLHLYEDLVIPEIVDDAGHPVPPGETGARLLVTVLFSRTLPLIRYEMSDRVRLASRPCPCGRPFALVAEIDGRREDVLRLPGVAGAPVAIHPNVVEGVLEPAPVAAWKVVVGNGKLIIRVTGPRANFDAAKLSSDLRRALEQAGALSPSIAVEVVTEIERTAAGKLRHFEQEK